MSRINRVEERHVIMADMWHPAVLPVSHRSSFATMSDPVADKSTFLCMYMSNHPDTLVSYVKYWGKVTASVTSAQMNAIDTKGMTLSYKTKDSGDAKKEVRVVFDPPLAGYAEVKPRLLNMKVEAEESLGMTRAPQITTFRMTPRVLQTATLISLLIYTTFSPTPSSPLYSSLFAPGYALQSALSPWVIPSTWGFMSIVHALESLYTLSLCKKHRTGFIVGAQYVLATLVFGYPIFTDMRHQVQAARIDSIMKGQ
ncbi:hypothetical protein A0H81_06761 [Grifola frondosa]|uniref:DUF2470 domain-containing protein n=1 Tax=Grifola frondosa TaxID=5627 RepID=A0A1C7M904_GRIFR|nr:hypothetical protein A0H81_06761 [Grifola frondosa]